MAGPGLSTNALLDAAPLLAAVAAAGLLATGLLLLRWPRRRRMTRRAENIPVEWDAYAHPTYPYDVAYYREDLRSAELARHPTGPAPRFANVRLSRLSGYALALGLNSQVRAGEILLLHVGIGRLDAYSLVPKPIPFPEPPPGGICGCEYS